MEILEHNPYLGELVITACRYLGFKDATGGPVNTGEEMRIAAQQAYASVGAYLRRRVRAGQLVECYESVWDKVHLREVPVMAVLSVKIGDDTLVPGEDYEVKGNRLQLIRTSEYFLSKTVKQVYDLEIEYQGGYLNLSNGATIFNACLLQTLASYHRRRLYGVTDISTARGNTIKYSSNKGGLTEEVEQILTNEVCYVEPDLEVYQPLPPYYPCSGYVEPGLDSLDIYNIWKDDANIISVTEAAEVPGFVLTFKFKSVVPDFCNALWINAKYSGNVNHVVKVKLLNTTTGQYDAITVDPTDFNYNTGFTLYNLTLPTMTDYVADETLMVRIEHESTGAPSHTFEVNSMVITS